ncbi:MAG: hypothetical protein MZW92_01315 [Comamonadaceae bacterium]|nr:hypothetical protein [Comamonadaceae bacterium]
MRSRPEPARARWSWPAAPAATSIPALAVADAAARARLGACSGSARATGMEARLVPAARRSTWSWVSHAAACAARACCAWLLLPLDAAASPSGRRCASSCRVRPDVVLGMGGYVAFPGGMMARAARTSRWSCTSRTRSPGSPTACWRCVADRVLTGFPEAFAQARDMRSRATRCAPSGWARRCARTSPQRARQRATRRAARCACWWSAAASARRR